MLGLVLPGGSKAGISQLPAPFLRQRRDLELLPALGNFAIEHRAHCRYFGVIIGDHVDP